MSFNHSEHVVITKMAIKEGLVAEIESIHKGATGLVLVLWGNVDDKTKLVGMTYKEMRRQTGFSIEFIRRLLNDFVSLGLIKKLSSQGSSQTLMKLEI